MKKYIITNYYRSNNTKRFSENILCLQKNLDLNFVSKVLVYCDLKDKKDLLKLRNRDKIIYINTQGKLPYVSEIINFCKKNISDDSIIIILNLDVYLANSKNWRLIDRNFFNIGVENKALVCTRKNINEKYYSKYRLQLEKLSAKLGDFADCIVFKTPIDDRFCGENLNFPTWASRGSDTLLMGLMCKHFHTYSWGSKYKIYHLHSDTNASHSSFKNLKDYYYKEILSKNLNIKSLMRMHEAARIPPSQNYKFFLEKKKKPKYYKIKIKQNILKIFLRVIYFNFLKWKFQLNKKIQSI
jgi:hypothetical protein